MKKAIWILFLLVSLVWTGTAFLAAGLARWSADAIASAQVAQASRYVALSSERAAQKLGEATGQVSGQLAASVSQAIDRKLTEGQAQSLDEANPGPAVSPDLAPFTPPLPAWVKTWLPPETVQSIEQWGIQAQAAAISGKAAIDKAAQDSTRMAPETTQLVTNQATTAVSEAMGAASLPAWAQGLAKIVGWLVPIVWAIWAIGMILGLLIALLAHWGVNRLMPARVPA